MTPRKQDLSERIIERMRLVKENSDPWDDETLLRDLARAAQEETAELLHSMANSLTNFCIRSAHKGSVKGSGKAADLTCLKCRPKIKTYSDIADLIAKT